MPLISLRKNSREAENAEPLGTLPMECYIATIDNLAQYAIELEEATTKAYQGHLRSLAREVEGGTQQVVSESRGTLRGLLRDYKDRASAYMNSMREELNRTVSSLERLIAALSQSDGDHESRMSDTVKQLRHLADSPIAKPVAAALRAASDSISQHLESFRQQQKLTVSQLVAEINLLHKRIDALEAAVSADDLTKLFNRQEIENRLRSAVAGGSLLVVKVEGFKRAALQFNSDVARQLSAAFVKRLRNNLKPGAAVGRWSEDGFVIILPVSYSEAQDTVKWVREHVGGSYACLLGGKLVRPAIQIAAELFDLSVAPEVENTIRTIEQFFEL
jgi:GGDEF domain-containing protein